MQTNVHHLRHFGSYRCTSKNAATLNIWNWVSLQRECCLRIRWSGEWKKFETATPHPSKSQQEAVQRHYGCHVPLSFGLKTKFGEHDPLWKRNPLPGEWRCWPAPSSKPWNILSLTFLPCKTTEVPNGTSHSDHSLQWWEQIAHSCMCPAPVSVLRLVTVTSTNRASLYLKPTDTYP